jgi:hypothetical protein
LGTIDKSRSPDRPLRVPLKTIQERIGHALTGLFTLDMYGHTLDWKSSEEAGAKLGAEIAKAVTEVEANLDSGTTNRSQTARLPNPEFGSR